MTSENRNDSARGQSAGLNQHDQQRSERAATLLENHSIGAAQFIIEHFEHLWDEYPVERGQSPSQRAVYNKLVIRGYFMLPPSVGGLVVPEMAVKDSFWATTLGRELKARSEGQVEFVRTPLSFRHYFILAQRSETATTWVLPQVSYLHVLDGSGVVKFIGWENRNRSLVDYDGFDIEPDLAEIGNVSFTFAKGTKIIPEVQGFTLRLTKCFSDTLIHVMEVEDWQMTPVLPHNLP